MLGRAYVPQAAAAWEEAVALPSQTAATTIVKTHPCNNKVTTIDTYVENEAKDSDEQ